MTYTPEWPSQVTTGAKGLPQFQESTFKTKETKPDQDALKKRVAALYAGKANRPTL